MAILFQKCEKIWSHIAHPKMSRTHAHPAHFSEWISHAHAHVQPHIARVRVRTHLRNSYLGVYPIQVDIQTIVNTYCLEEGWTVIQSRGQYGNPSDYFFKTSAEYKDGFGKPGNQVCVVVFLCLFFEWQIWKRFYLFSGEEHWLGLDAIYKLTNRNNIKMQLKIILKRFSGETASVIYDDFSLEDQVFKRKNYHPYSRF